MAVDPTVLAEQASWAVEGSRRFYSTHRNRPDDLYASERTFLPEAVARSGSMLDVGCAAGGFSQIARAFNPTIRYVGVDIMATLIDQARRDHPDVEFCVSDGLSYPFERGSFDLVHCAGVLHLNSRYPDIIAAMWRMTRRFLLFDVRLHRGPSVIGTLTHEFGHDLGDPLPYHVINVDEHVSLLSSLVPAPATIRARGYFRAPAATAVVPVDRVIMTVVLLERNGESAEPPTLDVLLEPE